MGSLVETLYPSLVYLQRHFLRRGYLREMKSQRQLRALPLAEQEQFSHRMAVRYVNHMAGKLPTFRQWLLDAGVHLPLDNDPDQWRRLPFMTKKQVAQDLEHWCTRPLDDPALLWTSTSGSSGTPFRCPIDHGSMLAEIVANEQNLRDVGWQPYWREGVIKVRLKPLTGYRHLVHRLFNNDPVSFASRSLSPEKVPEVVDELRHGKVRYLRGYPSALLLLADEMLKRNLRCPIPLLVALGEQLTPAGAQIIERAFEGKVYRDYGASEAQHIAFECREQNGYHIDLARYHLELLDGERPVKPGETGEIVLTVFRNNALPLVRYRIGDLATRLDPAEPCPCGSSLPRLGEVLGRVVQVLHTGSGQQISEFFFHSFVLVINNAQEHVARYKVLQKAHYAYEVLWVPRHPDAHIHLPELERRIIEKAQLPLQITWRAVDDIPAEASGKRAAFVPLT